ncbi:MAG: N-6 DNA methylase, partial [Acidobacteria bacterium]|nr:N-6 DNA methylase [Acidobacteriota bacterium]
AGFLISSWKHILKANTDAKGNSTLTPDEKRNLAANFSGYDISPDMVRLSLVNLYLHGFADPHIYEYDTLSSQDRWNDRADVILANPPFMSPKGGIRPHNRFSVQSKRSEVLFVDYMAEHLTPRGRAGIIVPEGIIFQSGTAYKQLRKLLVEEYLVAVVSLPAGVFNPYSGVKTSILILDRALAKRTDSISFFKVQNDGFGLGAQRREIEKNDLPQATREIAEYLRRLRAGEPLDSFNPTLGLIVKKEKIAANGDWNLSGERYRENGQRSSDSPLFRFEEVCTLEYGSSLPKEKRVEGPYPVVGSNGITGYHNEYLVEGPAIIVGRKGSAGEVTLIEQNCFPIDTTYYVKQVDPSKSDIVFLYRILKSLGLPDLRGGAGIPGLNRTDVYQAHRIPLPPLEVQKEIVAEIEGYQKVIDGARMVVENYRPHIPIDPDWPMVELGDKSLFRIESGGTPRSSISEYWDGGIPWATLVDLPPDNFVTQITSTVRTISDKGLQESSAKLIPADSVIVSTRATIGRIAINRVPIATNQGFKNIIIEDKSRAIPEFVAFAMIRLVPTMKEWATGGTFAEISKSKFCELEISLPSIEVQKEIVAEIEAEEALVQANRDLIARFEKKIQSTLARVWGGGNP